MERALNGSERAFSRLVGRHHRRLVAHLSRAMPEPADADDVAQQAWTRVWRHLHRFDPDRGDFGVWLRTIADRLRKNALRDEGARPERTFTSVRESRRNPDDDRPVQWRDASRGPERTAVKRQVREVVQEAVQELDAKHRTIFRLREFEGLTYKQMAAETGLPFSTVRGRLYVARQRFESAVAPKLGRVPGPVGA